MNDDPHPGRLGDSLGRYESIIEAVRDGVFVIDVDGTITYVNDAVETFTGRDRSELIGTTFETLVDSGMFLSAEYDRFVTTLRDFASGDSREQHLTLDTARDDGRVLDIWLSKHVRNDGSEDVVGIVRDVTDRERRARAAERKQAALADLYSVGADSTLTFEAKTERVLSIGCEYLDLPFGFLTRVEDGVQEMVHTVGDHELLQPDESAPLEKSYCRRTIESEDLVGMRDARTELGADDPAYELFELGCYIGTKVLVGDDLYGTFCFAAPHERDREFTAGEREVIKLLGQWTGYELEQQHFEERLRGLQQVSQQLLAAETTAEVAETTISMGADLFDLPFFVYWEYDGADDALYPLAETENTVQLLGDRPRIERGETLIWEGFDKGEIESHENLSDRAATPGLEPHMGSAIHVPCGNHGIVTVAATEPHAFDDIDTETFRLLGGLVREAMTAVKREELLAERGEALQRQNDRLEEFAHVVAHDLRNPLAGAVGMLEIARETNESHFFDRVERSHERMDALIDELLDIAHGEREEVTTRLLDLQSTVEEAWSYTDAPEATLEIAGQLGEIRADETRLLQLLGNLFRNSVEHAGDDVTVTVGRLPNEEGFYVVDDGPGLTDQTRTAIRDFERGEPISETGIGLLSITDVVADHDWDLSIPDREQGVRFEIRTGESGE